VAVVVWRRFRRRLGQVAQDGQVTKHVGQRDVELQRRHRVQHQRAAQLRQPGAEAVQLFAQFQPAQPFRAFCGHRRQLAFGVGQSTVQSLGGRAQRGLAVQRRQVDIQQRRQKTVHLQLLLFELQAQQRQMALGAGRQVSFGHKPRVRLHPADFLLVAVNAAQPRAGGLALALDRDRQVDHAAFAWGAQAVQLPVAQFELQRRLSFVAADQQAVG
ncbi:conserved hypothetical protein, partial [Ricinus communis]